MKTHIFAVCLLVVSSFFANAQTISITVEPGDQLGTIAQRYLKEPATLHWQTVAKLNKLAPPYTLLPGTQLLLPSKLLAEQRAPAVWISVDGDVRVNKVNLDNQMAKVGSLVYEDERMVVGANSTAVLQLADGSRIKLLANTQMVLDEHRYYLGRSAPQLSGTKAFSGLMRLIQGAVEAKAIPATDRAKPLRIQTPTAVVGVRGTEFRLAHDAVLASSDSTTRTEVLEGKVQAELDSTRTTGVDAGFGVSLDPKLKGIPKPTQLLEAPDLSGWKLNMDRPLVVLDGLPSLSYGSTAGAPISGYRLQISPITARDAATGALDPFVNIVYDKRFAAATALSIPNLADGSWRLRARAIDKQGIEGKNAEVTLVLKARPEPPMVQSPKPQEKLIQTGEINLIWATIKNANAYLLEVTDAAGTTEAYKLTQSSASLKNLKPERYSWRVATQVLTADKQLDTGPWSDRQYFTVVALPEKMQSQVNPEDKTLALRWADQKAAKYQVQVARDEAFKSPMLVETQRAELMLVNPQSGYHYIRYRAVEQDGFVGGWSESMRVDVPVDWKQLLIYLGGGLKHWP